MNFGGVILSKSIANFITASRIIFAVLMLCATPFSKIFWVWYISGGIRDLFDGIVARSLKQESDKGAKLYSLADLIFLLAVVIVIVPNITISRWGWICMVGIALIRFIACGIGYLKYHTYPALHTYMDKITGILFFANADLILNI